MGNVVRCRFCNKVIRNGSTGFSRRECNACYQKTGQIQNAHAENMRKMNIAAAETAQKTRIAQKNKDIQQLTSEISGLQSQLDRDTKALENATHQLEKNINAQKVLQDKINNFGKYKKNEMDKVRAETQLATALEKFKNTDKQIKEAINKTGQIEENVGKFLSLTHNLLGATVATTSHSNKLDAEITTFGELMSRECQDKLTLEQYFGDNNMKKFVAILAEEDFVNVSDLICTDEEDFNEIVRTIEKRIEATKDNDNDEEEVEEETKETDGEALFKEWQLTKLWPAMVEADCTDPEDWQYLEDDELKEFGFKGFKLKKFKDKLAAYNAEKSLISLKEQKALKQLCLNPDSWKFIEEDQRAAVKEGLAQIGPLMSEFFTRIHKGIKDSQKMLNYEVPLSGDQLKAIELFKAVPPKSFADEDEEKNEIDEDEEEEDKHQSPGDVAEDIERNNWEVGDKCELYSKSGNKWMDGEIVDITEDDDGEWLQVKYGNNQTKQIGRYSDAIRPLMNVNNKVALQSKALTEASIVSIGVTNAMIHKFEKSAVTQRAYTLATGVEDCCMQIVRNQGTIRASVLLAQEILNLRPAHMSKEAEMLWKAVDDGIIRILKGALNMVKISSQYFGFFLRFKQSFQFYHANEDKDLMVSLQHLKKDCNEFGDFQRNFSKTVKVLSDEAMRCIEQCVKTKIGADNFTKYRDSREELLQTYLAKKKTVDKKAIDLGFELDRMKTNLINLTAEEARLRQQKDTLQISIKTKQDERYGLAQTKQAVMAKN